MTKTDNLVGAATRRLTKSLSEVYEERLPAGGDETFFAEMDKLDLGLTKRLAQRPIDKMTIDTVCMKAALQFREMCVRAKQRGGQPVRASAS